MQLKFKKICLLSTIIVYCASFLLQSNFVLFETRAKETNIPRVNVVAILVDNKIYDGISDNLKWYASNYVQNKLSDTKALVMPLDLTNIHAYDIYRMMENIYFDGLKDVNSSLIGLIMVGDIPLPVVNQDGYIFPTVYPYVDFEDQKYVWDSESQYFVPNDHPEGQAEIWHGLINYGSDIQAYNKFFDKVKKYVQNPNDFIGDSIWYDDFIAQKEGFLNEKFPYYRNKIMFAEDLGYQRYSPLMRKIFRGEQSENAINIVTELENAANVSFEGKDTLLEMNNGGSSDVHTTKMVEQEIKTSFVSDYNDLFGNINMSTMRENIFAGGRWIKEYNDSNGKKSMIVDMDSSASKIQVKDEVLLGNDNFQGLLENLNDLMEDMVDQKISDNKYDMDIVIPVSYEREEREKFRRFLKRRCISFPVRYDNYYFGLNARNIDSAKDLSIYRGTYRNLESLNGLTYNSLETGYNPVVGEYDSANPKLKSVGASFDIFSNQVEGNRGYTMMSIEDDLKVYENEKKNKDAQYRRVFKNKVNDKFWPVCNNSDQDDICEDLFAFVKRWWGGATPTYLDTESVASGRYQLSGYKATDSWRSIFDMGGFQSLLPGPDEGMNGKGWVNGKGKGPQKAGASFKAYIKYSSPTERVGWENSYGMKLSGMPFARYVNNTPDIHMNFSEMDYWKNGNIKRVDRYYQGGEWQINRESGGSNIFTLAIRPDKYNNSCNYYPSGPGRTIRWQKYTYKVISSVVKHVSTTEDEINGVDRNRYGEGGILEGYYINLKNAYDNVKKNTDDVLTSLKSMENGMQSLNIKGKITDLNKQLVELQTLLDNIEKWKKERNEKEIERSGYITQRAAAIANLLLPNRPQIIDNLNTKISELDSKIVDLNNNLDTAEQKRQSINIEIGKILNDFPVAIEKDKKTLVDVYSAIMLLSADEIASSMEIIARDEGLDPENFYNKKSNLTKIGFPKEWISEFMGSESHIKWSINSILNSYSNVFLSINEQKARWNGIKMKLNELSNVNSVKIGEVSNDMDNIFNISSLLAVDDENATDYDKNEEVKDTILTQGTAESIIKQGQYASCPKNVAPEDNTGNDEEDDSVGILGKLDGECGIIKMRQWLMEVDKKGTQIVAAATADADFMVWLWRSSIDYSKFTQADWINQYVKWTKGPGYDSAGAKRNHDLLLGVSEHMSGMNLLTPDRPIDSPRYVSMQSIAGNEINFIYPDLFKVEVYASRGKNKSGYDIHELLSVGDIKNNLIKYLNGKVYEYNKIIDEECKKAEVRNAFSDLHYLALRDILHYDGAVPDASKHGCNAKFSYGDFVKALGGDKMLDVISETLYYQSLTNKKKLSSENVNQDIELIKSSFNLNDKRSQVLKDYLTWGNEKTKNLVFEIPAYVSTGYEVGFINSDGKDYIFADDMYAENYSQILVQTDYDSSVSNRNANVNINRQSQQEKNLEDECGIPPSGKLKLFEISGGSPWFVGFKCRLQNTLKSPVKLKLTFGGSLGDALSSDSFGDYISNSDLGQTFADWGESVNQYADSWGGLFTSTDLYDSDKVITQMQVDAEKHNQGIAGGILYNIYKNVRISNGNALLSDANPSSEVKIESMSDVGNITVEFLGTGDGCIKIDSQELCNGKIFKTTFNPKTNPFVGIVSSFDHVAGKVALVIRITIGGEYIENVVKYTVSPGPLDHVDIKMGNDKTIAGMMTPIEIIGFDANNNKISWGAEKYDFTVSQGLFYRDLAYQTGFSTNDFRNLKFYYKAPLDADDGSVATIQVLYSGNVLKTYNHPIVKANPVIKVVGKAVSQGDAYVYNLSNDESIYVSGKLEPKKLQRIEIEMVDLKGKIVEVDSQISVRSQNGLLSIGQVSEQNGGDKVFLETYKAQIKGGKAIIYYYPTTLAGDDVISVDIPGFDTRAIKFSIQPAEASKIQLNLSDEYVSLNKKTDLKIFVSDMWGNPISKVVKLKTDPRYVDAKGLSESSRDDDSVIGLVNAKDGTAKVPIYGAGGGLTFIEVRFDNEEGSKVKSDVEFRVDDSLLPETGLNIMYLNYFGNDRGNQRGYLSDNNKRVENMMKNSNKIIATTTLLASEDKIKKVLWKIDPGFKILDLEGETTTLIIGGGKLYMSIGGLSEMEKSLPHSFDWLTATFASIDNLLVNQASANKNYIFFVPNESNYSIKNGILYNSNEYVASIKDGELTLQLTDDVLDNGDNIWNVVYNGTNYGSLIMHFPNLYPKVEDFNSLGNRYVVDSLFANGSTDQMFSVGIFDTFSDFELYTNYKSIQNSDEVDERIGFLGDFKNITLFAEGQNVGDATKLYGSELLINLGDPVLSRKDLNEKVYGTNYDGGIGREIYTDPEKDIFGVYQIDFNNDGLKDLLVAYQDGSFKLAKNYGRNPDLKGMQELMRVAVRIKNIFVGDVDGNGYQDILVLTDNDQIRAYLNNGGIFDVDGNVVCLNQNVFEGEISDTPSNLEGLNQFFVEDMDLDGFVDIITYDAKGYIKVFYGGSTKQGPNYLSTEKYACDTGWYDRQAKNITIVTALGVQISEKDIFDNSMIRWVGVSKPEIKISSSDLSKYGVNFDPDSLVNMVDTDDIEGSISRITRELMSNDKFDVGAASSQFIQDEGKFQDVTLYENTLVGGGESKNYVFAVGSFLDPNNPEDKCSVWKNYSVKSGGELLMNNDIVTVKVTVKASDKYSCIGTYGDIIQGPWNLYYDDEGKMKGIRFLQNQKNAVVKSRDGNFSYLIDNIRLSPGEKMVFEYDLEYYQIPLRKMSITYKTFWSDDKFPDIKLQSVDGCEKNFDGFINSGKRSFKSTLVPLQELIDKEYEEEDKNTRDYASETASYGGNLGNIPGLIGDRINRIKLLGNQPITVINDEELKNSLKNAIFSEAGISLNIDLSIFEDLLGDIEGVIDDIMQGMCNGFSFGGSNNCKGLPVPFNQAFLAPGKYHLFGCWEIPTGPLEKGIPMFFFPGTIYGPFGIPLPIPMAMVGPTDEFIWAKGGVFPSLIRIYAAPTLTAQLGMAICMGPQNATINLPSPISDLGGNCVVFAIKPQCNGGGGGGAGNDSDNPNEVYQSFTEDVKNSGVCLQSQKGSQVTKKGYRSSPFNLYKYSSKSSNILGADVHGGSNNQVEYETSFLGIIDLETSAHIGAADSGVGNQSNSISIGDIKVAGGKYSVNKIRSAMQQGIRQIIIDKWLDPQIRYILNQLTKMHINIKLPDMSNLIDNEVQTMRNLSENIGNIGGGGKKTEFTKTNDGFASKLGVWSYVNSDNLDKINESISNPFESLASLMNESNIINISVEPITVKVPMISAEDINGYEIYLRQWLDVNEKIVYRWKEVVDDFKSANPDKIQNHVEFDVLGDWQKLQDQVYVNLMTLQKYRNFPFEIYEWIHVIDRYMAEIISLINNTIGYLSYWISTNSQRFVGYVDAIVLIINIIKTYQMLINFSVDRGKSCGSCTKDTYDQYSCKLSMLCSSINLPILQIPNFKLPNITLDFSNIDIGLDIILPSFNFQPVRVQLPELPNLPEPPTAAVNLNLNFPNIPMLPEPPELPELPSFIPEVELELPVLPPAPELPMLPSVIESIISIAKMIGKIYCIVKGGLGLVGEGSVKAKIEQLTQRTYEVKWIDTIMNLTNISAAPVHNYGMDYEISAQLDLQFEFSSFYDYLDALTKQINNLTTSSVNWVNNKANTLVNDNPITSAVDAVDGMSIGFNAEGNLSMSDLSNIDFVGLESDDIEYVDYDSAKSRLKEVLAYFAQETKNTTMGDSIKSSISSIENQINMVNVVSSNIEGLEKVKDDAISYLDSKKLSYDSLAELINDDYDGFLAMVDSDEINKSALKTGQLLTYNVNLFNLDSSTKDVVNNIRKSNPYEAILSNKKTIIDGYWNAINSNTASDLGLSQAQYLVLRDSISSMKNQVTTLYSVTKPVSLTNLMARNSVTSTSKTLVSAAGGGRLGSNMEVANVVDPSVLSEGIYGKILEGDDKGKLAKIVYADSFASTVGDKYYHTTHDDGDDVILWDEGSIYLKCAGGVCSEGGGGYKGYYISNVISQIPYEEMWITFAVDKETKLKIADSNVEIKNWEIRGQTYDDLRFSWQAGDADAYLIKLVQRVDNSYEKSDYTSVVTPVIYVLAVPKNVTVDDLYSEGVKLEVISKNNNKTEKFEKLYGKELVQIVNYDENQDVIDVIISDVDRKWYYARIATLELKDNTYSITSPWSNQVVAGKQIVGDDISPEGNSILFRPAVNQVVSEGDNLDGYVGTKYKLIVNWEDNVALSYISLLKDGEILDEKYTSNTRDSVSTEIDIHTELGSEKFNAIGIDQFGNRTEKVILVDYSIPEISITDVLRNSDGETLTIKAELSQDIDQGNVSFQRGRGVGWKTMARRGIDRADFPVGPEQKIVVGSPYSMGNEIAMYDKNGETIALMDPITAEITLQSGYRDDFEIRAVVQNGVVLQIFNKKTNESVFTMNVPAQTCLKFEADNYNIVDLPENGKMGIFNGGKAIYRDGSNVLFASSSCYLYSDTSTSLEGTYGYDRELDAVVLTLYQGADLAKSSPIKVWFKVKPLIGD